MLMENFMLLIDGYYLHQLQQQKQGKRLVHL